MDNERLQQEIKEIETELLNLKSIQGSINSIQSYSVVIHNPSEKVKITYEDGEDDIICKHYIIGTFFPTVILTTPHNNVQYILTDITWSPPEAIFLMSTRPIKSVEML